MRNKQETIVVFDMDETLGHFVEISVFCEMLETLNKRKLRYAEFRDLMDMFPEFLRPNIIKILNYVKKKKQIKECDRVLIYTNNQGPKEWARFIARYLEEKIGYKLFDQIIGAYKIGSERVETRRTSHEKNISDLVDCCDTSKNSNICFLDDQYYNRMRGDNVYYVNVKPYVFIIPYEEMALRYYMKHPRKIRDRDEWVNKVVTFMDRSNYDNLEFKENNPAIDNRLGKETLMHLQRFFKIVKPSKIKTRKRQT